MKLDERLQINDVDFPLITADVVLEESVPGRATFSVQSASQPKGVVFYDCGYAKGGFYRFFIGYVEKATRASAKSWSLFCRELSFGLSITSPVSLRNCELPDVVRDVKAATKVDLVFPSASYSSKTVPRFANTGDGLHAIRNTARVFGITDFVFYQLDDGTVWFGSYPDSKFAELPDVEIPEKFFSKPEANNRVTVPAMPVLRPGHRVNGHRLNRVRLKDQEMTLSWNS